jgi:hypothetical protein
MGRGINQRQKPGWQKVRKPLGGRTKPERDEAKRQIKPRKDGSYNRSLGQDF